MSSCFQATVPFLNGLMWLMSEAAKELEIPAIDGVANFWASHNAWGIAVLHIVDGEVQLSISDGPPEDRGLLLLHEGVLHSSRRLIEVQTVYIETVARFSTRSEDANISIWGDDPGQPERVHVQCPDIEGDIAW